jgi:hypothetical protein
VTSNLNLGHFHALCGLCWTDTYDLPPYGCSRRFINSLTWQKLSTTRVLFYMCSMFAVRHKSVDKREINFQFSCYGVSLYVILHELAEGSSKCFKFHYLSQSILLDTYFLFLSKKFFVSITLENPNWPIFYVFVLRFLRSYTFFKGN